MFFIQASKTFYFQLDYDIFDPGSPELSLRSVKWKICEIQENNAGEHAYSILN